MPNAWELLDLFQGGQASGLPQSNVVTPSPQGGSPWELLDLFQGGQAPPSEPEQPDLGPIEGVRRGLVRGGQGIVGGIGGLIEGYQDTANAFDIWLANKLGVQADPAVQAVINDRRQLAEDSREFQRGIRRRAEDPTDLGKSTSAGGFNPASWRWWTENVSEAVPQLLGQTAVAAATGGGSLPAQIGTFAATGGALEAGGTYSAARERMEGKGIPQDEAMRRALAEAGTSGAINAAIEVGPGWAVGKLLGKSALSPAKRLAGREIAKRWLAVTAGEGGEEATQQVVSDTAQWLAENDPEAKPTFDKWREYAGAGLIGAAAGAGLGGVSTVGDIAEAFTSPAQPLKVPIPDAGGTPPAGAAPTPPQPGVQPGEPPAGAARTPEQIQRALAEDFYGSPEITATAWADKNPELAAKLVAGRRYSSRVFEEVGLPKMSAREGDTEKRRQWLRAVETHLSKGATVETEAEETPPKKEVPSPDITGVAAKPGAVVPSAPAAEAGLAIPQVDQQAEPVAVEPPKLKGIKKKPAEAASPKKKGIRKLESQTIGKNAAGQDVFEDANGIRSTIENGIRSTEPVQIIPTQQGVQYAPRSPRDTQFEVAATVSQAPPLGPLVIKPIFGGPETKLETKKPSIEVIESPGAAADRFPEGTPVEYDWRGKRVQGVSKGRRGDFLVVSTDKAHINHEIDASRGNVLAVEEPVDVPPPTKEQPQLPPSGVETPPGVGPSDSGDVVPPVQKPGVEQRDYGTVEKPSRVALGDHFGERLTSGAKYGTILEARSEAGEKLGGKVTPGTPTAKEVDEAVELGVVKAAKAVVAEGDDESDTYDRMVDLYERQPNLSTRTSTSISQQAYSTPAPLAYLASRLANVTSDKSVYDATAGNGMLLVAADPSKAVANELNASRAESLKSQGIATTTNDATDYRPSQEIDSIILNPPFGTVRDESNQTKTWTIEGVQTREVDHAIVMNSLSAMADDGSAVLILGAKGSRTSEPIEHAKAYSASGVKPFYDWLYDNYGVTDHFTVSGDLYSRQGASFPVDVIVIKGRSAASRVKPWNMKQGGIPIQYNSWQELKDAKLPQKRPATSVEPGTVEPGGAAAPTGQDVDVGTVPRPPAGEGGVDVEGRPGRAAGIQPAVGGTVGPVSGRPAAAPGERGVRGAAEQPRGAQENVPDPGVKPEGGGRVDTGTGERGGLGDAAPALEGVKKKLSDLSDEELEAAITEGISETPAEAEQTKKGIKKKPAEEAAEPKKKGIKSKESILSEETKAASKDLDDAAKAFADKYKGKLFTNPLADPELIRDVAKLTRMALRAGYLTFRDYTRYMADAIGADLTRRIGPAMQRSWDSLRAKLDTEMDVSSSVDQILQEEDSGETEFQTTYTPRSGSGKIGTLVPANLATAIRKSLDSLESEYGDLDAFVGKELGMTPTQLNNAFAAEQVDALALAIGNHKRGAAFVLGCQTGVGKGRVVAGMIRYAKINGMVPLFITEKPDLFGDMVRDLTDIGMNEPPFEILVTGDYTGKNVVQLPDGRQIKSSSDVNRERVLDAVSNWEATGELKSGDTVYDAIFTQYSQIQPISKKGVSLEPWRYDVILRIAPRTFVIFDESHNAGGSGSKRKTKKEREGPPNRAKFLRSVMSQFQGVLYSSATFAKRPDVMDLYSRTDMAKAVKNLEHLPVAIEEGGVPLQQVVSEMLAESGQYVRREKSFQGIKFEPAEVNVDLKTADNVSEVFRSINQFDVAKKDAVTAIDEEVVSSGKRLAGESATGDKGVTSTNFSSILWNLTDQMLLSLKADQTAQAAINAIKAGQSPVIVVDNTMESALNRYVDAGGLKFGDPIDFNYRDLLLHYLERSREVTIKHGAGIPPERHYLTDEELGPEAVAKYEASKKLIGEIQINAPVSPIDWIRKKIKEAGYSVAEVTGRETLIDYRDDGSMFLTQRAATESGSRGKTRSIKAFNDGSVDVLILNRSGSTGLSIHASQKVKNKKTRHMIISQPAKNIDEFMQMLGRVNRTGQVVLPQYTLLLSDAPAENRPAAVLVKKLASLNATVTGKATGSVGFDTPDIINEVGDYAVARFMEDYPQMYEDIGEPMGALDGDGLLKDTDDIARKVTGRVILLPIEQQRQFWDGVIDIFNSHLAELDNLGENPLVAKTLDLQAKTQNRMKIFDGQEESTNPFEQPAYLETVDAKRIGKPMSSKEVTDAILAETGASDIGDVKSRAMQIASESADKVESDANSYFDSDIRPKLSENKLGQKMTQFLRSVKAVAEHVRTYPPGTPVSINLKDPDAEEGDVSLERFNGIVMGVYKTGKAKNPVAMSSWVIDIAVSDAVRRIRVPISQVGSRAEIMLSWGTPLENRLAEFDKAQSTSREVRHIATGNLLAAQEQLRGKRGRIVFFTDDSGESRRGTLMPRRFDVREWQADRPIEFQSVDQVLSFLTKNGTAFSADGNFYVVRNPAGSGVVFSAKKAKSQGGKYTLNRDILNAASPHEFVSKGAAWMEMPITNKQQTIAVLKAVMEITTLQANTQKDLAAEVIKPKEEPPGTVPGAQAESLRPTGKARTGQRRLTRKDVIAAFPQRTVTNLPGGTGWRVEVGSHHFDIQVVDEVPIDWDALEAKMGLKIPEEQRAAMAAAGSFSVTDETGKQYSGLGLIRLANGMATSSTLRHEALHLARTSGMLSQREWDALVKQYSSKMRSIAQQEEDIASAREGVGPASTWQRIAAWIRGILSKFGIGEIQGRDVFHQMDEAGFWDREAKRTGSNTSYSIQKIGDVPLRGRPDLANPAKDLGVRDVVTDVDEERNLAGKPTPRSRTVAADEATQRLAADYSGERQKLLDRLADGDTMNEADTVVARRIIDKEGIEALKSGKLDDLKKLIDGYRDVRAEQARALSLRDPLETPAMRRKRAILEAILSSDNPTKILEALKNEGIDLTELASVSEDPAASLRTLEETVARHSTFTDKAIEYWRNAILSAPTTHAANTIGNVANTAWYYTAERFVKSALNTIIRNPKGAQWGEYKHLLAGILPGMSRGMRNAVQSWKTERSALSHFMGGGKMQEARIAIPGRRGRFIRSFGYRPLLFADEFAKTLIVNMEVGAQAYRMAKE